MGRQSASEAFDQKPPGGGFCRQLSENLVGDVLDEHIAIDALVTDRDSRRIDVKVLQHGLVEGLARQKNVKTFLDRGFDVDEIFAYPGRAEPHGALSAVCPL